MEINKVEKNMAPPSQGIASLKKIVVTFLALSFSTSIVVMLSSFTTREVLVQEKAEKPQPASTPGCDLFSGKWVYENSSDYSPYSEKGCSFMSEIMACERFGRKDLGYRQWRWQPLGCDLPRFDPKVLIEKLRGKRMVFVGDSLTWNQWVSILCLLESAIPSPNNITFQPNGAHKFLKIMEYNISIEHHWSPLLVESNGDDPVQNQFPHRIVRAESITKHARLWTNSDFLIFDNYVWWKMPLIRLWWGALNDSQGVYKDVDSLRVFNYAMKTWATWLEFHTNTSKTKLFFMSMSPCHLRAEDWGGEIKKSCYGETDPVSKHGYRGGDTDERFEEIVADAILGLRSRMVNVKFLNITQLSEYRKDAHPSIYRQFWNTVSEEQRRDPNRYADCIHWCLPGVPDVWNQILYSYIVSDHLVDRR